MNKNSMGVTRTERMLASFCESTFLKLWSYPNPYKDDGHELCDLLAIFDNKIFIFFDRDNNILNKTDKDFKVLWGRWKRDVIDSQTKTAHGAERYIKSGREIYADSARKTKIPLVIDFTKEIYVYKIVVAHGAKEACENASPDNVYGSLSITYSNKITEMDDFNFHIFIEKEKPIHIFDSQNLAIIFGELDTVTDFSDYLDAKHNAILKYDFLSYYARN